MIMFTFLQPIIFILQQDELKAQRAWKHCFQSLFWGVIALSTTARTAFHRIIRPMYRPKFSTQKKFRWSALREF
ncbi:hypothetical protein MDG893_06965 [Marinobacter algicola DG893]|uniref:Uncharacterized protein n=1 Tax=Marinobacter algicola DG893 TaxID=443152 RepID=A6EVT0_9GAMM|nr:hypothetical protein MDG893_06965 [Marinobacter algicola DG893]